MCCDILSNQEVTEVDNRNAAIRRNLLSSEALFLPSVCTVGLFSWLIRREASWQLDQNSLSISLQLGAQVVIQWVKRGSKRSLSTSLVFAEQTEIDQVHPSPQREAAAVPSALCAALFALLWLLHEH